MKTIILFCISFSFGITGVLAQVAIKPTVGVNFTDFSKDPSSGEYKARVGWQVGGSVAIGKKFYIEPGFFYMKKSTEFQTSSSTTQNSKFDISGVRIPVAVGVNVLGNEKSIVNLHVFGGGSAFLLTAIKDLDKDDFETASWGVFAGAGIDIAIIFVDFSYEWSLTELSKVQTVNVGKSRSIFINAGVRIPL